jgi:Rha family phage regulatory protein
MAMSNDCLEVALTELAAVGIVPEVSYGGKHIKLRWHHNGDLRQHTVSVTASDWRAPLGVKTQIRGTLKEDGLIGDNDNALVVDKPTLALRNGTGMASSLAVAKHFSKAHKDVLRAIDRILEDVGDEFGGRNFAPTSYVTDQNKEHRCFDLTRDGFVLLAMGFTGDAAMSWKVKYIEAFNAMEAELRKAAELSSLPAGFASRLAQVEADLKALIDLSLGKEAGPGFVYVKAHRRRSASRRESAAQIAA